jgi:hypothetical protein
MNKWPAVAGGHRTSRGGCGPAGAHVRIVAATRWNPHHRGHPPRHGSHSGADRSQQARRRVRLPRRVVFRQARLQHWSQWGSEPERVWEPGDERPPRQSITVSVVAYVNLTRQSGAIAFIHPAPGLVATTTTDEGPVKLRTTMGGRTIAEYPAHVAHNRIVNSNDDDTGIIDVLITVDIGASIQLVLNGAVIDAYLPCE